MQNHLITFYGLIFYQLSIILLLAIYRMSYLSQGKNTKTGFKADGSDVGPFGKRIIRVHANGFENIPIFLCTILLCIFLEKTPLIQNWVIYLLIGRIGQGLSHLISINFSFVMIRFIFFLIQLVSLVMILVKII